MSEALDAKFFEQVYPQIPVLHKLGIAAYWGQCNAHPGARGLDPLKQKSVETLKEQLFSLIKPQDHDMVKLFTCTNWLTFLEYMGPKMSL